MSLSSIYRTDEDPTTPNLKSVMAKLAVMNPQQLQAFAAAHEHDPIMLSAAQAVKNSHDEFMQHKMAMQGGMPAPVNQQVVQNMAPRPQPQGMPPQGMPPQGPQGGPPQGMPPQGPQGGPPPQAMPPQGGPMPAGAAGGDVYDLPEDVGIGRLPTPNIARMAEGGITGFSDEEPVVRMADGGMVAFAGGGDVPRYQVGGVPQTLPGGLDIYSQGAFGAQQGDIELQKRIAAIEANPRMRREDKDALIARAREEFGLPKTTVIPPTRPLGAVAPAADAAPAVKTTAPASDAAKGTSPLVNKDQSVVDKAIEQKRKEDEAAAAGKKLPPEPGLPSINAYMKQFEANLPAKEKVDDAAAEEAFMKKRDAVFKPVEEKTTEYINKQKEQLKTDREQAFYMSLIEGGLAIAGGESQYALQNIAKGAAKGAAGFNDALKDFRKAAQENEKMQLDLSKAQAAHKLGNMDAWDKHQESAKERNSKIDQLKASGVASLLGHQMTSSATLGAAKYSRDAMMDYRNTGLVESIKKNIDATLKDDPKYKFDATAREAEAQRRLNLELKKFPDLAQYAGTPTTGGASGASTQGWGKATIIQPQR